MDDQEQAAIDALRARGLESEARAVEALRARHNDTMNSLDAIRQLGRSEESIRVITILKAMQDACDSHNYYKHAALILFGET